MFMSSHALRMLMTATNAIPATKFFVQPHNGACAFTYLFILYEVNPSTIIQLSMVVKAAPTIPNRGINNKLVTRLNNAA